MTREQVRLLMTTAILEHIGLPTTPTLEGTHAYETARATLARFEAEHPDAFGPTKPPADCVELRILAAVDGNGRAICAGWKMAGEQQPGYADLADVMGWDELDERYRESWITAYLPKPIEEPVMDVQGAVSAMEEKADE